MPALDFSMMSRVIREQSVTVIELGPNYDSLDDQALQHLGTLLLAEASEADPPRLLLDLSGTNFIGSSFIGLLVRTWKRIRERDGTMALCELQPFCVEALENTRLIDTLWSTYSTRDEAVAALEGR